MNKFVKTILSIGVCGTLLFSAAGCKPDDPTPTPGPTEKTYDTETRVLKLSTGALDKNFNPFFYTAQNDGNMIANTQIGMLTSDEDGHLVCGQDYPTAVLDYKYTMYTTKTPGTGSVTTSGSADGRTEYEFVIKNGIKFSDGTHELTIADVLFNLYVYLDPSYTGSSTIYSTDIQGLKAYRAQDPSITDDSTTNTDSRFTAEANLRIQNIFSWLEGDISETEQIKSDVATVKAEFLKELQSDWVNTYGSWREAYKDSYRFSSAWEAFLFEEGLVENQMIMNENGSASKYFEDTNGDGIRQDGELYYTTLDPNQKGVVGGETVEPKAQQFISEIEAATTDAEVSKYMQDNGVTDKELAIENIQRDTAIEFVYNKYTDETELAGVLMFWATGATIFELFTNEARSEYFKNLKTKVSSVSGITTYTATKSELNDTNNGFKGRMGEVFTDDEYSVLKIVINGVDPKAIYNFSFTVAPLYYYSGTWGGVNYVDQAMKGEGFGIPVGDTEFIQSVLQDPKKVALPVGAGPYMASDTAGNPTSDPNKFEDNNIVSFVRNPYFETTGTGMSNAKIKKVQYKVLLDDQIMDALTTGSIDFGAPNGTPTNMNILSSNSGTLGSAHYDTGGYGYIGINPKFIPEYTVRQAIMKAMNTAQTIAYYGNSLARQIYRPMSYTSWAYPKDATEFDAIAYAPDSTDGNATITKLVEDAGYKLNRNGIYEKVNTVPGMANAAIGTTLKLTFTIAGDTTDHPAYQMFNNTATRLNRLGFDITVKNSSQALKSLATGDLAVWAAAWTSALDPDPYQVYHKDSKATSVLNWNYNNILADSTDKWNYEKGIIEEISDLIDEGRAYVDENVRTGIYHDFLDKVMELAVELPTYQRQDLCVYNKTIIDANSLVKKPSSNMGLFDKLWEIDYV